MAVRELDLSAYHPTSLVDKINAVPALKTSTGKRFSPSSHTFPPSPTALEPLPLGRCARSLRVFRRFFLGGHLQRSISHPRSVVPRAYARFLLATSVRGHRTGNIRWFILHRLCWKRSLPSPLSAMPKSPPPGPAHKITSARNCPHPYLSPVPYTPSSLPQLHKHLRLVCLTQMILTLPCS